MSGDLRIELPEARKESHLRSDGPAIAVRGLDKSYDDNHVLDNLTFEFERGKVYVVMGPSGCGKSTLLRQMIGAEHPDVAVTANNLAVFFKSQKKYEAAEQLYRYALDNFEKELGPKHPKVVVCRENYAKLLRRMNRG